MATPSVAVSFEFTTTRVSSDHNSHTVCYLCCCVCGVWSFFALLHPSLLVVFYLTNKFNSDVSKWNTGAVTSMANSKCTLSLSRALCGHGAFRCGVLLNVSTTRGLSVCRVTSLTRFVHFCLFVICNGTFVVVCVWWVWSFFALLHPSLLAVFYSANKFNSDVSTWNTGAVTSMSQSKCTLFSSLWPRLPLMCLLNIYVNSNFIGSQFSLFFAFVV